MESKKTIVDEQNALLRAQIEKADEVTQRSANIGG